MPPPLPIPLELEYLVTPDDAVARVLESPTTTEILRRVRKQLRMGAVKLAVLAILLLLIGAVLAGADPDVEVGHNRAVGFGMALGVTLYCLLLAALQVITSFRGTAMARKHSKLASRYIPTGPQRLRADETAIEFATTGASSRHDWSEFTRVEETKSYIALVDRFGNTAAMIPRETLADHAPAFLDFAREQMTKAPPRAG